MSPSTTPPSKPASGGKGAKMVPVSASAAAPPPPTARGPGGWTAEQWEAISDRGNDLLVSAAAGSGKTAALTERVMQLVTGRGAGEPVAPTPLDALLVITFTRKAAREMRERIEQKILSELEKEPSDAGLRAAAEALPRAWIMTLDAFCDRLARRYFHRAGIAPNARIADEGEDLEIESQAAREIFERLMEGGERAPGKPEDEGSEARDFAELIQSVGAVRGANPLDSLARLLRSLNGFIVSLEDPDDWTAEARADLEATRAAGSMDALPERRRRLIAVAARRALRLFASGLDGLIPHCAAAGVASVEVDELRDICSQLDELADGFRPAMRVAEAHSETDDDDPEDRGANASLEPALLAALEWMEGRGGQKLRRLDADFKKAAPDLEGALKTLSKRAEAWVGEWGAIPREHWLDAEKLAAGQALALLRMAETARARAERMKLRRALLSFNDVERLALKILTGPEGADSDVAAETQARFAHVLVDECQDISPLQNAIIRRVSRTGDVSADGRNLFVVGDVKQSIYRFRRADPDLFIERLTAWATPDGRANSESRRRIDLRANFRSRPGVIDFVNALFERLMDREIGGVEYDETHRLVPARSDAPDCDPVCVEARWILPAMSRAEPGEAVPPDRADAEIVSAADLKRGDDSEHGSEDGDSEMENLKGVEAEADFIAARIREMTAPGAPERVHDDGKLRPVRPGDCAILVRRLAADMDAWIAALARRGVRAAAAGQGRILVEPEILDLLAALRLADNPFQDFPLAAVMRSPMGGFDENDLLRVRMGWRRGAFYEALWRAAGRARVFEEPGRPEADAVGDPGAITPELLARLTAFVARLERWRAVGARSGAEAALDAVLADTAYDAWLLGLPDGPARTRNIEELRLRMREHAARSIEGGLAGFLAHVDELGAEARSAPGGEEAAENSDAVRLMTIHKSKGLEFPVVFLPGLFGKYNTFGRSGFAADAAWGLAMPGVDPDRRLRFRPLSEAALRGEDARHQRAEEMRLMYVAMTRARERLVLVGTPSRTAADPVEVLKKWSHSAAGLGDRASALARLTANSPGDLIAPALARFARESPAWLEMDFHPAPAGRAAARDLPSAREALRLGGDAPGALREAAAREFRGAFGVDPAPRERAAGPPMNLILVQTSPAPGIPSKVVASALRRDRATGALRLRDDEADPAERDISAEDALARGPLHRRGGLSEAAPDFIARSGSSRLGGAPRRLAGAARGTLTHQFIRRLDLSGPLNEAGLRRQAGEIFARGLLDADSPALLDELPFDRIAWFFAEPLGRRIAARPGSVSRELAFRWWIRASDLHRGTDVGLVPAAASEDSGRILVQGAVDLVMDEGDRAVIVDFKTDVVRPGRSLADLAHEYQAQIETYRRAIRSAWRIPVEQACLVFLDARVIAPMPEE